MSRFSLLNGLGGQVPTATLPIDQFSAPQSGAVAAGLAHGAYAVGRGLEQQGRTQEQLDKEAQYERERAQNKADALQEKLHNSEMNLWHTNLATTATIAQREAVPAALKESTIEGARAVIDARYQALRDQVEQQQDPEAKARGLYLVEQSYTSAMEQAVAGASQRVVSQTGVGIDANIRETVSGIGDGSVSLSQGLSNINATLALNADALGPEKTDALRQSAGKQAIGAAMAGLQAHEQLAFLATYADVVKKYYDPEQIKDAKAKAQTKIDEASKGLAAQFKQEMDTSVGALFSGPIIGSKDDLKRTVNSYADAIVAADPKQDRAAIITGVLIPNLQAAAELARNQDKAYAQSMFDTIASQMPSTGAGNNAITTQQNELDRNAENRVKTVNATDAIVSAFIAGGQVENPSQDSLNAAYKQVNNPAAFTDWLLRNNIDFPDALNNDIQNWLGAGLGSTPAVVQLDKAMPILEMMRDANPIMATRTLAGMKGGDIGNIALQMTRGLDPRSDAYRAALETLNNPSAKASIAYLDGKDGPRSPDNAATFYSGMTDAFGGQYTHATKAMYDNQVSYWFAWAQQHQSGEPGTQVEWAKKRALDDMRDSILTVKYSSAGYMGWQNVQSFAVPAETLGLGSNAQPDTEALHAFQDQLQAHYQNYTAQYPGSLVSIMPDLAVRDGIASVIPVMVDGENHLASALLWNPITKKSEHILADDPRALTVKRMIETGLSPEELAPDAGLRHPYGVTHSIKQFDLTFFPDHPENGLGQKLLDLSAHQWRLAFGDLPDWSDKDQKQRFSELLKANADRLEWSLAEPPVK